MRFNDFRAVIASMPTPYQSATAERETWEPWISQNDPIGVALRSIFKDFGKKDEKQACISRSDLRRLAKEPQLERFVMATILWGYETPAGMRGNNFANFAALPIHLSKLMQLLSWAEANPNLDWDSHFKKVAGQLGGIGLSTYTKLLTFLSVKIQGHTALIMDDQIIQVVQRGQDVFAELNPLRGLNNNPDRMYPDYLNCIHTIADELRVPAENLELFLYKFGSDLKDIDQNIRLRAYELYVSRGRIDGLAPDDWLKAEAEVWGKMC